MNKVSRAVILTRGITSHVPRIRGLGVLLALVACFFRKRANEDVEASVFGRTMLLNPAEYIGNALLFTPQWYDPRERAVVTRILHAGDYVVDVGANIGAYTLIFADLVGPRGRVTAIEAEPSNAKRLRHNIQRNAMDWVQALEYGVSDKEESLSLHLNSEGNGGAHSFLQRVSTIDATRTIQCKPLFELIGKIRPKLIKLDIEGFEWRVLRRFFEDSPESLWPQYVFLEDEPRHREHDAVDLVCAHGYRVMHRFDNNVFLERQDA
jgi:FkbM family methyltransferase